MIDTHCHLDYLNEPELDIRELTALIAIGADPEHAQAALALSEQYENVYSVIGLHPTDTERDSPEIREQLEKWSDHPKVVGIGETGLDDHWKVPRPQQWSAFEWQLDWAKRRNLPIVIHTRDAPGQEKASLDCADILKNANWTKGVLHCCNGHVGLIETGLGLGFYISFAGNLTYKNAKDIQSAAQYIPINRILLETDAPFLTPMPHRGKPNRPIHIRHTLNFLAHLRSSDPHELERMVDENARRAFGLPGELR